MRKASIAGLLIGAMALAGVAVADPTDVIEVTSKAPKGGEKKKPKPVGPEYTLDQRGGPGERAETPLDVIWWWDGIKENSKKFPTCSAEEIEAAQSDSVCPKKSLTATGEMLAQLGPVSDRSSNVDCVKQLNIYNAPKKQIVWFIHGPASQCAGVAYLPPLTGKWKKKNGSAKAVTTLPENIRQPLPGVEGVVTTLNWDYRKLTKKKNGEKIGFLESVGCDKKQKQRVFHYQRTTVSGDDDTVTADAGKC